MIGSPLSKTRSKLSLLRITSSQTGLIKKKTWSLVQFLLHRNQAAKFKLKIKPPTKSRPLSKTASPQHQSVNKVSICKMECVWPVHPPVLLVHPVRRVPHAKQILPFKMVLATVWERLLLPVRVSPAAWALTLILQRLLVKHQLTVPTQLDQLNLPLQQLAYKVHIVKLGLCLLLIPVLLKWIGEPRA